jgi:cytochrome P450
VSFVDIAKDPNIYPSPELVKLDRSIKLYIVYGTGPHECLGGEGSEVALTAMLKVVRGLDNLRAAPSDQGSMKKIPRPGGFYTYMDALQSQECGGMERLRRSGEGGNGRGVRGWGRGGERDGLRGRCYAFQGY